MEAPTDKQTQQSPFQERYNSYNDQQLMEILRNHQEYQPAAVTAAVKIAIERKLINSEQDLLAPEFQNRLEKGFSIFPKFRNELYKNNMISGAVRILYLYSILPLVYGIMSYAKGEMIQSFSGMAMAFLWLSCCYLYFRTNKELLTAVLISFLVVVFVFTGNLILKADTFHFSDLFILVVAIVLPAYLILFYRNLKKQK